MKVVAPLVFGLLCTRQTVVGCAAFMQQDRLLLTSIHTLWGMHEFQSSKQARLANNVKIDIVMPSSLGMPVI